MRTIKNSAGKTICRVECNHRLIEIVHKGCRSWLWFDETGCFHQIHEPRPVLGG